MQIQSIILRREFAETPTVVTGVTVRYADGSRESLDCLEDRAAVLDELEGFIFAPLQTFRVWIEHDTQTAIARVEARDREEALAKVRQRYSGKRSYIDRVQPTSRMVADF
jgi:hypothetical protein